MKTHIISWPGCKKTLCGKKSTKGYAVYMNLANADCGNCQFIIQANMAKAHAQQVLAAKEVSKVVEPTPLTCTTKVSTGLQLREDISDRLYVCIDTMTALTDVLLGLVDELIHIDYDVTTGNF